MSKITLKSKTNLRGIPFNILIYFIAISGAIIMIIPFLWMISTSLKEVNEIFAVPVQWFPKAIQWINYKNAFSRYDFLSYFKNSTIVSVIVTFLNIFICSLAGYSLAKFNYKSRKVLFLIVQATMMLPFEVLMVPLFLITKQLNMLNTLQGQIIPMGMTMFENAYVNVYHELMAIATIAVLPMSVIFFFMQNAFIRSMTMSGLKE